MYIIWLDLANFCVLEKPHCSDFCFLGHIIQFLLLFCNGIIFLFCNFQTQIVTISYYARDFYAVGFDMAAVADNLDTCLGSLHKCLILKYIGWQIAIHAPRRTIARSTQDEIIEVLFIFSLKRSKLNFATLPAPEIFYPTEYSVSETDRPETGHRS